MLISVIIPVYCSSDSLLELIPNALEAIRESRRDVEILLVDDASPTPETWKTLEECRERFGNSVKIVRLATNSGQHSATLCGMEFARGDVVVTMDDDLQNPASEILALVEAVEQGADVAIAAYEKKQHNSCRNFAGRMVDSLLKMLFHLPRTFQLTSFRAFSGGVCSAVLAARTGTPYLTALLLANSSRRVNILTAHEARKTGSSNYTLGKSLTLALTLVFNYSLLPVFFVGTLCMACMLLSIGIGVWSLYLAIVVGTGVPGWASIMVTSAFLNSITLLALTIYGIYLSQFARANSLPRKGYAIVEQKI